MLTSLGVYTEAELRSRCEILLENYCKTVGIEAKTMVSMAIRQIAPAAEKYAGDLASRAAAKKSAVHGLSCTFEQEAIAVLSGLTDRIYDAAAEVKSIHKGLDSSDPEAESFVIRDRLIPAMAELRRNCDLAEELTDRSYWPFPTYGELMFGAK